MKEREPPMKRAVHRSKTGNDSLVTAPFGRERLYRKRSLDWKRMARKTRRPRRLFSPFRDLRIKNMVFHSERANRHEERGEKRMSEDGREERREKEISSEID